MSTDDPAEIQRRTYASIREAAPRGEYNKLAGASGYRKALSTRPDTLMTQIRMYRNKPAYLAAVALLHKCGANLARATFLVSLISFVILALLLRWWLGRRLSGLWASALCLCLMFSHPVFYTGRMSAPDMFSALFVVPALLLLLEQNWRWGLGLLIASITVRPDAIILVGLVCLGLMIWPPEKLHRRTITAFGFGALALHTGMHWIVDPYPHRVLLKHALVTRLFEPSRMGETISWAEYLKGLDKSIFVNGFTLYLSPMWLYGLLAGLAIYLARQFKMTTITILVSACCIYVVAHILLFPVRNDRFFAAHYMFIALAAIHMVIRAKECLLDSGVQQRSDVPS